MQPANSGLLENGHENGACMRACVCMLMCKNCILLIIWFQCCSGGSEHFFRFICVYLSVNRITKKLWMHFYEMLVLKSYEILGMIWILFWILGLKEYTDVPLY